MEAGRRLTRSQCVSEPLLLRTAVVHASSSHGRNPPKRSPAQARDWVFEPKPSFASTPSATLGGRVGLPQGRTGDPNILEHALRAFDRRRAGSYPRQGSTPGCDRARLRALPWAAGRPSRSPRSSLHRPCARAATPPGAGQSTTPHRCRRGIELGERRAQGVEGRGVGKPVFFGRFRPASGQRRFNGRRRRHGSRCCSVRS
jgi:hypothetical protein